jgi:quercetin dioxygenase-like cupin family protein
VIVFSNTAVASNPTDGTGVVRRGTGIRFDRLTLVLSSAANGAALGGLVGIPVFIAWHWLLQDIHGESFSLLPNWMAAGAVLGAIGNIWWRLSGMTLTEAQLVAAANRCYMLVLGLSWAGAGILVIWGVPVLLTSPSAIPLAELAAVPLAEFQSLVTLVAYVVGAYLLLGRGLGRIVNALSPPHLGTQNPDARLVRRTLLTDENVEETGIRFDHLTLAANASFRFEPSARSMVWFQVLEGDAKLKAEYMDGLSDRHSVFLPPAFDATLSTERRQSFWRWLFHQEDTRGVSLLRAEIPDARRFDPEFSTKQPLFAVLDWTREMVLQCKNDGRKRVPLLTAETCQTAALKVQMLIYPPGTKSASYRHEDAESFIYLLSGRGTAGTHDQSSSVRKGDLIWFRDDEWHRLEAAADSEMRFLILYAPGVFHTAWEDPSKASAWSPTGLDINGRETARGARERIAYIRGGGVLG